MTVWVRLAVLVALLCAGGVVLLVAPLPGPAALRGGVEAAGAWGPVLFVAGYAVATLLVLPKNVLSAAAGFAFGLGGGVVLVWTGAMLGAVTSFWLGRLLGRDGVARLAGRHLDRLDVLVARHGAPAVLVARLVPVVPFTAVNYGSGLTAVRFPGYATATAIGIVPGTVAYVAVGSFGTDPTGAPFLLAAGALLALTLAGWWVARRRGRLTGGHPTRGHPTLCRTAGGRPAGPAAPDGR